MQKLATRIPGLYFQVQPPATEVTPLRTDVAGFLGTTQRGPVGEAFRIEGWRQYLSVFGGLIKEADTPYAIRGYFENGGEVAYVVRLMGVPQTGELFAHGEWVVGKFHAMSGEWDPMTPSGGGFQASSYKVQAATPGTWANGTNVLFRYRLRGTNGQPQVDVEVRPRQEAPEYISNLSPNNLAEAVAERSQLIRLEALTPAPVPGLVGPLALFWGPIELSGAREEAPSQSNYTDGVGRLGDQREVALLVAPDLHRMAGSDAQRNQVLAMLVAQAENLHDRQVFAAPPPQIRAAADVAQWVRDRRLDLSGRGSRSLSVYHPSVRVPDPLGGIAAPLRDISPLGHVTGVVSRLDRERGSHHTPANAILYEAVDVTLSYDQNELGVLSASGINPLRCFPGRGLQVWGGRTAADPALDPDGLFIAHRRLIHRLVRAIRRVAEPLVFDSNGPGLWLTLVRAITTVLLQAFRAGALKGKRPEEAFRVQCDEKTSPPEERELGRVLCEIEVAPAVPMEFITLRIAVSTDGRLELIES
jgi:uncharacterized protein